MYMISTTAPRAIIEAAADALTWLDPSPAEAVDAKEETRITWRLDVYTSSEEQAYGCAGIIELFGDGLTATVKKLEDKDWVAVSLEGLPAVEAGPFVVAGAHELAKGHPGRIPLWIEAGPAFGTGHHGTTSGCLFALESRARRKKLGKVLDIGTGSGVLAIAAIKRGATSAIASDLDWESVRVAKINAENNHVSNQIKMVHAMGTTSALIQKSGPYDTVFANILARPLIGLSKEIARLTRPGGTVILSGLLRHQEPSVRAAYNGHGMKLVDRIHRDGWSTLIYEAPKRKAKPAKPGIGAEMKSLINAIESGRSDVLDEFLSFDEN